MNETLLALLCSEIDVMENPHIKKPLLIIPKGTFEQLKSREWTIEEFKDFISKQNSNEN